LVENDPIRWVKNLTGSKSASFPQLRELQAGTPDPDGVTAEIKSANESCNFRDIQVFDLIGSKTCQISA
jgi:hypothetical protein